MIRNSVMLCVMMAMGMGCASAPETRRERHELEAEADRTMNELVAHDASIRTLVSDAAGYVVFPTVGEGGFIAGGGSGVGVVYDGNDHPIGYSELRMGSVGAQVGGQSYSQLVVFQNDAAFARLREGEVDFGADATATAVRSGATVQANFENGVAVIVDDENGMMAGANLTGERMNFIER